MKWYKNLYFEDSIEKNVHHTVKKINAGKLTPDVYVIALASNPSNLMDIIPTWELMQPKYPKENLRIIGLSQGKKEAFLLVEKIVKDVIAKNELTIFREHYKEEDFFVEWRGR